MPAPVAGVDGNWACGDCGNVNFAVRQACNRCQSPRPNAAPHVMMGSGSGGGKPVPGVEGNWLCEVCQNVNFAHRAVCNRCQSLPSNATWPPVAKPGRPVAGVDGNWECPSCQNVNFGIRTACNRCQAPKPDDSFAGWGDVGGHVVAPPAGRGGGAPVAGENGNWACSTCSNVNFPMRTVCNRCQQPKPHGAQGSVVVPAKPIVVPARGAVAAARGPAPPVFDNSVGGQWECDQCQSTNGPMRTTCFRCSTPRPQESMPVHAQASAPAEAPAWTAAPARAGPPVAGVDGNWACPACGNVNWAVREACNRCQGPKPAAWQGRSGGAPMAGVDGNWACLACHNINFAQRQACNRCQAPRHTPVTVAPRSKGAGAAGGAPVAGVNGNWLCLECQNVNFPMRDACNRCAAPKPASVGMEEWASAAPAMAVGGKGARTKGGAPVAGVDGNWLCEGCQNVNFGTREYCNRCQAPKPPEGFGDLSSGAGEPDFNFAPAARDANGAVTEDFLGVPSLDDAPAAKRAKLGD